MQDTPWSDGAPGLTQKPIESGQSFIYRFKAEPAGTHWWHSHSRTTLLDGLYGPIFIRYIYYLVPRCNKFVADVYNSHKAEAAAPWSLISEKPEDIAAMRRAVADPKLVLASDWTQFMSWQYMEAEEHSGMAIL